jgi:hypothetical protein
VAAALDWARRIRYQPAADREQREACEDIELPLR